MSDFEAKIHQVRFPRFRSGTAYSAAPDPLAVFKGPTSGKIGEGERRQGKAWKGRGGNGRKAERRWREGFGPPKNFGVAPPMSNRISKISTLW